MDASITREWQLNSVGSTDPRGEGLAERHRKLIRPGAELIPAYKYIARRPLESACTRQISPLRVFNASLLFAVHGCATTPRARAQHYPPLIEVRPKLLNFRRTSSPASLLSWKPRKFRNRKNSLSSNRGSREKLPQQLFANNLQNFASFVATRFR